MSRHPSAGEQALGRLFMWTNQAGKPRPTRGRNLFLEFDGGGCSGFAAPQSPGGHRWGTGSTRNRAARSRFWIPACGNRDGRISDPTDRPILARRRNACHMQGTSMCRRGRTQVLAAGWSTGRDVDRAHGDERGPLVTVSSLRSRTEGAGVAAGVSQEVSPWRGVEHTLRAGRLP